MRVVWRLATVILILLLLLPSLLPVLLSPVSLLLLTVSSGLLDSTRCPHYVPTVNWRRCWRDSFLLEVAQEKLVTVCPSLSSLSFLSLCIILSSSLTSCTLLSLSLINIIQARKKEVQWGGFEISRRSLKVEEEARRVQSMSSLSPSPTSLSLSPYLFLRPSSILLPLCPSHPL